MSDRNVERWRQQGRVFLWRYRDRPRSYAGWNLTADPEGATSLLRLLELMRSAPYSSEQTIAISAPTPGVLAVPNRGGEAHCQSARRWHLRCSKLEDKIDEWSLVSKDGELQLSVGVTHLSELIVGVEDIMAGKGDYAIGAQRKGESDCLWFWWWIEQPRRSSRDVYP